MKTKIKTTLIITITLVITLAIGIIIGAMLNRALVQNRIRRAYAMVNPDRFITTFERTIQPTPDQRKQVREIIQEHAMSISEIREDFHKKMISSFESMRKQLDAVLTPAQKKRLEETIRRPWLRRDRMRKPRFPFKKPKEIPL